MDSVTEEQVKESKIKSIIKRDGRVVEFNPKKIVAAIMSAANSVGGNDVNLATTLANEVVEKVEENFPTTNPSVENVQDLVEKTLIDKGHARTAKAFILHRYKKEEERRAKAFILGDKSYSDEVKFSTQALSILKQRYLKKDEFGNLIETPTQMLDRVAVNIAQADALYGADKEQVKQTKDKFFKLMANLVFLPTTPTLMNAGVKTQLLNSTFVLPIYDTMESIFGTLRDAAVIHQRGGGTGFSFSQLRPLNDPVKSNLGVASGPLAFMQVYNRALDVIKQGGIRPGANMAVLRVDHPDIIRFIESKRNKNSMQNFNISVAVTDNFMRAVEEDREYYVINPRTQKRVGKLRSRDVFALITQNAWKSGDPGLLFIDEINRKHPAKHLGEIESTNQCAETPLLPYESCALGAINLFSFVKDNETFSWEDLKVAIETSIHFLDNVIDMNKYPQKKIEEISKRTRKIGLGVMGFADTLCALGIKYDSQEGLDFADKLFSFIKDTAYEKSASLAKERGSCEAWQDSDAKKMRNMTCLSLSPTGTRSILADCSAGCEPLFAISYHKAVLSGNEIIHLNSEFEKIAKKRGFYSPTLIEKIARQGNIQNIKEIPKDVRDVFVTAQEIAPLWHIKMQATVQKHVDNAISKTINFSATAAIKDVEEAYLEAWKRKCKGITIYRDGSYEDQVINVGE